MVLPCERGPDRRPVQGEAADVGECGGREGLCEGDEGVEVVDVEGGVFVEEVGCFGVDAVAGAEEGRG